MTLPRPEPVPAGESGRDLRLAAREGFRGLTVGRAAGFRQANLAIVPARWADALLTFCAANPVPCPVLGWGAPGQTGLPGLGTGIDVRTDLPRYEVHQDEEVTVVTDLVDLWRDDLVAVAVGCWFGAEAALRRAGVRLRHVELGIQGPLFRTAVPTVAVGPFAPNLVVSMRPFQDADVARVTEITGRLASCHGAPLHAGDPSTLGIGDVRRPDWGEVLLPEAGETSLFWGCGLTVTEALRTAGVDFFVTHAPGSMLVTDCPET